MCKRARTNTSPCCEAVVLSLPMRRCPCPTSGGSAPGISGCSSAGASRPRRLPASARKRWSTSPRANRADGMTTYLNALCVICSLGAGKQAVAEAMFGAATHGLHDPEGWVPGQALTVGDAAAGLPALPAGFLHRDTRNNRLLMLAAQEIEVDLRAAIGRFGAERVGIVVGTSTTGIE